MQLLGFHHLTAVTAHAKQNVAFYTQTLGMRLVKKTVNQDDVTAYHLFYADGAATPGSDITFFDWPMTRERRGGRSIVRTGFRVGSRESLNYWVDRLREMGKPEIIERNGRDVVDFEDFEGQRLSLCVDERPTAARPWEKSPVPAEHQILGLGPIAISVPALEPTEQVLTTLMNMRRSGDYTAGEGKVFVFEMGDGGPSTELHVAIEPELERGRLGAGGVHHVAFRVPTREEYDRWAHRLNEMGMPSSGPVDRYYFRSLYFREPGGILFELATDGPGFATDEPLEQLGESLALPPFLEPRRKEIEAGLKPL